MARNNTIEYIYKAINRQSPVIKDIIKDQKKLDVVIRKSSKVLEAHNKILGTNSIQYNKIRSTIHRTANAQSKYNNNIAMSKKLYYDMRTEIHKATNAQIRMGEALSGIKQRSDSATSRIINNTRRIATSQSSMRREIKKTDGMLARFGKGAARRSMSALNSGFARFGAMAGAGFGLYKFFQVGTRFEDSILDLAAITGAAGKDLEFIKGKALSLGRAFKTSQDEVVEGMKLIASAQAELLDNPELLASTTKELLKLKNAAGIDMALAAKTLGISLDAFGVSASKSADFVNILAAGAKLGASEIPETAEALKIAAGKAASAGISFVDLNAMIQAVGGTFKGSMAGTAFNTIITRMQKLAGIDFTKMKPSKAFGLLRKHLDSMDSELKKSLFVTQLFGMEHDKVAQILINNVDKLEEYEKTLYGTNIAQEQVDKRLSSVSAKWRGFVVILQEKVITAFEKFKPKIDEAIENMGKWLDTLTTEDIKKFSTIALEVVDDLAIIADALMTTGKAAAWAFGFFGEGLSTGKAVVTGGRIDYSLDRLKSDLNKYFGTSFDVDLGKINFEIPPEQKQFNIDQSATLDGKNKVDVNITLDKGETPVRRTEIISSGPALATVGLNAE